VSPRATQSVERHRIIAGFVALSALLLTVLNVMCQRLVTAGLTTDRLIYDYVNDVMVVPIVAGVLIAWRSHIHWLILVAVAALMTAIELIRPTDLYDIAIYWVGALAVIAWQRHGDAR
jgi:hypothetical protein